MGGGGEGVKLIKCNKLFIVMQNCVFEWLYLWN